MTEIEIIQGEDCKIASSAEFINYPDEPIVLGDRCVIRAGAIVYGGCEFGADVSIGHNSLIREHTKIGRHSYIGGLVSCEGHTTVGTHCGLNANSHLTAYMTIEDYVFFGPGVVTTNDKRIHFFRKGHGEVLEGPTIKYGCRIGANSLILPGVTIGEQSIIGGHSNVTKDIPPFSIAFGNPARVIRHIDEVEEIIECERCKG